MKMYKYLTNIGYPAEIKKEFWVNKKTGKIELIDIQLNTYYLIKEKCSYNEFCEEIDLYIKGKNLTRLPIIKEKLIEDYGLRVEGPTTTENFNDSNVTLTNNFEMLTFNYEEEDYIILKIENDIYILQIKDQETFQNFINDVNYVTLECPDCGKIWCTADIEVQPDYFQIKPSKIITETDYYVIFEEGIHCETPIRIYL